VGIAGFAISVNTLPPLVTSLAVRYAVNTGLFGLVFFSQYVAYAIASFLSGYISGRSRLKTELLMTMALAVTGVMLPFIGLLPAFPALVLFMMLIGGCGGLVETNGTAILTRHDRSSQGTYIHMAQLAYCLGAMLAPMLAGILQARQFSDGSIGAIVGSLMLLLAIVVHVMVTSGSRPGQLAITGVTGPPPAGMSMSSRSHSGRTAGARSHSSRTADARSHSGRTAVARSEHPETRAEHDPPLSILLWFMLAILLYVMIEIAVGSWLPAYLEQGTGMTASAASLHLTLFWTGLAATRFLYTLIHSGSIRTQLTIHICGILTSIAILSLMPAVYWLRATAIILLGAACGPVWPLIVNLYSKRYAGERNVMYMVGSGSIGALLSTLITAMILETFGMASMMAILAIYATLLFLAYLLLMRCTRQAQPRQS
jgi:fucose permease